MLHIGIVACSSEGAALCYRTICTEGMKKLGPHKHPEISMHTPSFSDYVVHLDNDEWKGVAGLMLNSANKLAQSGADFLICPDNTIHKAFPYLEHQSPLPWLHIAEVVSSEALRRDYKKLGITGTKWLVESEVYPEKITEKGLSYLRPNEDDRNQIHRIIMEELVAGEFKNNSVEYFQKVITGLKDDGCDAVILGCTEIPLIINDNNSSIPTLDSTRLLAKAALEKAIN